MAHIPQSKVPIFPCRVLAVTNLPYEVNLTILRPIHLSQRPLDAVSMDLVQATHSYPELASLTPPWLRWNLTTPTNVKGGI